MTSIEMPESVWQSLNAAADELNIVASNLRFSMDCQLSEMDFLREAAHAIARTSFLANHIKTIIKDCYICKQGARQVYELPTGIDMDEEAYKEELAEEEEADFYVRADNRYHAMIDDMLTEGGGKCKK